MWKKGLKIISILIGIALLILMVLNIYVYWEGQRYVVSSYDNTPHAEVAIILGAAITMKGNPSPVLEDRILTAIDLYKRGIVSKILMSGNNDSLDYNEVNPVKKVLMQYGIPEQDIFLDHAGFDTYSTMYRAEAVFKVQSAIIVTQTFHLPRALYLARSVGIDAYGIPADRGDYSIKNYIREIFARPNAFFDVMIHRVPKYLGEPIPITGDGSTT